MEKWCIGVRREDKDSFERRTPLIPAHVRRLVDQGMRVVVQPSAIRVHTDDEYTDAGAEVSENLDPCRFVVAVKEVPIALLGRGKTYLFFSHTLKGQRHNMPLLQRMLDLGCSLLDYELIKDAQGRRLVAFGRYAGLAGMIETLRAFGRRCEAEGLRTPFARIEPAWRYAGLREARDAVAGIGREITEHGLPEERTPLVCGIVGYGNVSGGAQEICDLLPIRAVDPRALAQIDGSNPDARRTVFKTVFAEEHLVERRDGGAFALSEYYERPELYRSVFSPQVRHLTLLVNTIYWDPRYPVLLTREEIRELWAEADAPKLRVIGDITCDVDGSIQSTVRATAPDDPAYLYLADQGRAVDALTGRGPLVMAVDNLPCEFPLDASADFSRASLPFIEQIARAHDADGLDLTTLARPLSGAVIALRGQLTPAFQYLRAHLDAAGSARGM
jgi:alpha-aminoadipic semialdehyde synthase